LAGSGQQNDMVALGGPAGPFNGCCQPNPALRGTGSELDDAASAAPPAFACSMDGVVQASRQGFMIVKPQAMTI